jgi:hypothetical protein
VTKLYRMKPLVWVDNFYPPSCDGPCGFRIIIDEDIRDSGTLYTLYRGDDFSADSFSLGEAKAAAEKLALEEALRWVEEVTPEAPRWIPVGERMPPDDPRMSSTSAEVLVCDAAGVVFLGWWDKDAKGWTDNQALILGVTHWMPLPEPPKGGA